MKLSTISVLAFTITPALSAAIGSVRSTNAAPLPRGLFDDAKDFPDKVKCPKTDGGSEREFKQDDLEDAAKAWKDKLNDKKSIGKGDQAQGYPARYAIGRKDGTGKAKEFWENTERMKFPQECLDGYIWEMPLLASGKVWSADGGNGDAGPYRLYFLAKDGDVKFCGSAIHDSKDLTKGHEFSRCKSDD
ncbi:hypothetical protein PG996_006011 [Apiospora saccharicola]|uniref:Uncharacterized protein n=1 Tax=Apiospora saccharicola TaxID=335842 RepID=A0ABR1VS64_9PEZI